jgi:acetolactate synthase-1/2/3 large subunit
MAVANPSALTRSRTVEIEEAAVLPAHELEGQVLSGARITCAALEAEGIDFVFGYPGGAVIPLYDAIPS